MLKVVKVRLYPTDEQKISLAKAFGCCRWFWNYSLNLTNETYKSTGKGLNRSAIQSLLPKLKKQSETQWLSEPYSQCLQVVALNLSNAFINFFEGRAQYPSFKSKYGKQSLTYPQNVKLEKDKYLKFPKLGSIYAKIHRSIEHPIKSVTVSKTKSGQYHASLLFDDGRKKREVSSYGKAIGVDLGLNHFCITSDGSKFDNPKWFFKYKKNLKIKQQRLYRREMDSNNRNKARIAVAKVREKIIRCRKDFLHKLSLRIVDQNQVICVENLNVKGMVKNHHLAQGISQAAWVLFCTMLKYKSENLGKIYLEVDRFFPSSNTCHNCLYQIKYLPLEVRYWDCPSCGSKNIDRDINTAINLRDEGLRILASRTGVTAYCSDIKPTRGRKKSTN